MSITLIIILIILGIILFLIEFLLIPGVTVAGIGGAILMIGGVILGYHYHGMQVGNFILLGTVVLSVFTLYLVLKSRTWQKIMLDSKIDDKVNQLDRGEFKVKAGDTGIAITRLNPMGKVLIQGEYFEAKSLNKLIDQKTPIIVTKISGNKIIVKSQN